MKYLLTMMMIFAAVAEVRAAQDNACEDPGIAGLYMQAVNTGGNAQKKALGAAMFTVTYCLSKAGVGLSKSQLRGPYAVVIEYLAYKRQVSINMVSDDEIDAMARNFKKGKCKKTRTEASI